MWPKTLNGGTQSGLCVQLRALAGYAMHAHMRNLTLVLPNFSSHVARGSPVPFEQLFDANVFQSRLAQVGVVSRLESSLSTAERERPYILSPPEMGGFHAYKMYYNARYKHGRQVHSKTRQDKRSLQQSELVERATLDGLVASRAMREQTERAKASLGLNADDGYGCIHARIEADMMLGAWTINSEGQPPRLADYLGGVEAFPELRRLPRFFVAVGKAISRNDSDLLDHHASGAVWPRLMRSGQKTHHNGKGGRDVLSVDQPSYIAAALTDFLVCRDAAAFIGWSGSSFSMTVAHGRERWYSTCPGRMERLDHFEPYEPEQFTCDNATARPCVGREGCRQTGYVPSAPLRRTAIAKNMAELWDGGPVVR